MNTARQKKISAKVRESLAVNTNIALEANTAFGGRGLTRGEVERLHDACAVSIALVIAEMIAGGEL